MVNFSIKYDKSRVEAAIEARKTRNKEKQRKTKKRKEKDEMKKQNGRKMEK